MALLDFFRANPYPSCGSGTSHAFAGAPGPDDSGTVLLKDTQPGAVEVALGHRRLAILDLSPLGHQPIQDPVTGNWIVFNGEVCNFREDTRIGDVAFRSHADTEVILPAYPFWGQTASPGLPACLQSGLEIGAPDAAAYAELHRRRKGKVVHRRGAKPH